MPDFLQRNPLVLVLAAFAAVLIVVLGFETGWGTSLRSSLAPTQPLKAAAVDAKLLPPLVEAAPEEAYPETGTRPLFTPTRRPAPVAETVGSMVKGQFVLQGVTILGTTRIAMLRDKNGGRVHRVEKGKDVNGVTVAEIEPDRVTLRQGGDSEIVAMVVQRPAGAAAAPPPPPAAAAGGAAVGPFGAPVGRAAAPPPPGAAPPGAPAAPRPGPIPAVPTPSTAAPAPSAGGPMPSAPPAGAPAPPGTTSAQPAATMTPEEILARRRARRAQQGQ